ncbi:Alcohol dehydrogenase, zinc-binding domain protein [Maricaulis maris MCS10]|uniref:Alcohol dehydrogenase, zinc-binding domain protein n=1 Tax=Maricaulis maris (strain MCS10) TaxID=394221 RepID=Q0ALI2_MARMM|nr:NAD(P)H-quinone oxidoreductase [Maricaulis maris]ABI66861.1 Alcohol dehydrogenase, zinc-binding domain protein [Maricaulis maris MCS10]
MTETEMKPELNRIVIAREPGGPDVLDVVARPIPSPAAGEILIRNTACGVNRPDQIERLGFYPAPPGAPEGLGLEVAGHVEALGEGVTGYKAGDPVCALVAGGGYAAYSLAPAGSVLPVPEGVPVEDAAGLPETVFTVWTNVFEIGALSRDETLLVHGGTSGIGSTAIQLAKAAGARVIATAGTPEKVAQCRQLGADIAINYRDTDFETVVTEAGGADVILDMVGGGYVQKNINCARVGARIASIAFLAGSRVEVDLMRVMLKRITLTGSTLRARPVEEKARLAQAVRQTVWPWIADGKMRPLIDSRFDLDDARSAHERLDSGEHAGKILLLC